MGRQPCCEKVGLRRGSWTSEEDSKLVDFILNNGIPSWRMVPKLAGLMRCGKSCRLRWMNYLRPDLKRGGFTDAEEDMIIQLHSKLGNRWSKIASHFPGRTDNEIKNQWNTRIKKKLPLLNNHGGQNDDPPPTAVAAAEKNDEKKRKKKKKKKTEKQRETATDDDDYSSSSVKEGGGAGCPVSGRDHRDEDNDFFVDAQELGACCWLQDWDDDGDDDLLLYCLGDDTDNNAKIYM